MSIWGTLLGGAAGLAIGGPLGALIGAVVGQMLIDRPARQRAIRSDPDRRQLAFTIAAIALCAKMARADGTPTEAEFRAFRRLFQVAPADEQAVTRFYEQARQSTDGFEAYARQMAELFGPGARILEDLLDALFLIATVDPPVSPAELAYLQRVATLFGFSASQWVTIQARHIAPPPDDPFRVLGLPSNATLAQVKAAYRKLARQTHPDALQAQGVPPEFRVVGEQRMAALNAAYAQAQVLAKGRV
jgi:DnaJ like chaperone protein